VVGVGVPAHARMCVITVIEVKSAVFKQDI
jgi:hypothetical protein